VSHARQQIRQAAVGVLQGATDAGSHVYAGRPDVRPLDPDTELPGILIETGAESIEPLSVHASGLYRTLPVRVTPYVRADANVEDTLDNLLGQIETAFGSSAVLMTMTGDQMTLAGLEEPEIAGDGSTLIARQTMNFQIRYSTPAGSPGTFL
jgi:hypothetical protein